MYNRSMETTTVRNWLNDNDMMEDSDRLLLLSILAEEVGVNKITNYSMRITVDQGKRAMIRFFKGYMNV